MRGILLKRFWFNSMYPIGMHSEQTDRQTDRQTDILLYILAELPGVARENVMFFVKAVEHHARDSLEMKTFIT